MTARDPFLPKEPILTWSRLISCAIAIAYVATAGYFAGAEAGIKTIGSVSLPLVLIWFPEFMGGLTEFVSLGRPVINKPSPPGCVAAMGWFFLCGLPPVLVLIAWWMGG